MIIKHGVSTIYEDNQGTIALLKKKILLVDRDVSIDIKHHFCQINCKKWLCLFVVLLKLTSFVICVNWLID